MFVLIAVSIYGMQLVDFPMPAWVNNYVNDFLCMPIVLIISRSVIRWIKLDVQLQLPVGPVIVLTLFYAFFFEGFLPDIHPRYTGDALDVFLYFLGSMFFLAVQYFRSGRIPSIS